MTKLSFLGENIVGSQIIKLNNLIKSTPQKQIYNYTIGDFDPKINPIPEKLRNAIIHEYIDGNTNYPQSQGELDLRKSISTRMNGLYQPEEILVGAGVRPLIYTMFQTILDLGDKVLFPVPSWNNDHYTFLSYCNTLVIETLPENNFNLSAHDILVNMDKDVKLICLCSPQNPTGTAMNREELSEICKLILSINENRLTDSKPVYLFLDQIYVELLNDQYHLLIDYPEMKDYLICLDGVSKSLCATGVRVGWMMASNKVIDRATQIFSHIGAWSPKPEQLAVGKFLNMDYAYELFVQTKREQYANIINGFIEVLEKYKNYGFDYVKPDGGIYLSIKLPYRKSTIDLNFFISFLVSECGLGIVPFDYFGTKDSEWFRLSIGGVDPNKLQDNLIHFEEAILKIKKFNEVVRLAD